MIIRHGVLKGRLTFHSIYLGRELSEYKTGFLQCLFSPQIQQWIAISVPLECLNESKGSPQRIPPGCAMLALLRDELAAAS